MRLKEFFVFCSGCSSLCEKFVVATDASEAKEKAEESDFFCGCGELGVREA